jgi:perosamine synthetase
MDYHDQPKISMSSPDLTEAERQAVMDVVQTRYLSMGPYIQAFEEAFQSAIGCRYAIGVSSGTAGLHLCVHAAGIQSGDFVITTPFSFVSSSNVLLYERAVPIYVDVDPKTGNIDAEMAAQAANDLQTGGTAALRWLPPKGVPEPGPLKAILSVDVFGQPADFAPLNDIARKHQLKIINDSCESLGAEYQGLKAGKLGDYGVFAFYPNKQITTGEGGMIVTDDEEAAQLMRALRNQGRVPGDTWLDHTLLGYNYRLDELSAALGAVQMQRLDELIEKRTQVAAWYQQYLAGIDELEPPFLSPKTTRVSWFVYVIRLVRGIDRASFITSLAQRGIPVRPYFSPIHLQPYMVKRFGYQPGDFPITEDLGSRGLALPFSSVMREEEVRTVCNVLKDELAKV